MSVLLVCCNKPYSSYTINRSWWIVRNVMCSWRIKSYYYSLTVTSVFSSLRKFDAVAVLLVPVSPTRSIGCRSWICSFSSQVVRTVSTVGTKISLNLRLVSWMYSGIFWAHGTHLSCSGSQKYSNRVGSLVGNSPVTRIKSTLLI